MTSQIGCLAPATTSFGRGLPGICVPESQDQCHSSGDLDLVNGGTNQLVGIASRTPPRTPQPTHEPRTTAEVIRGDAGRDARRPPGCRRPRSPGATRGCDLPFSVSTPSARAGIRNPSSTTTGRSPGSAGAYSAANATECASTGPVLRPLPVAKIRTCADSFGGTSTTRSRREPAGARCVGRCRCSPRRPTPAHRPHRAGGRQRASPRSRPCPCRTAAPQELNRSGR